MLSKCVRFKFYLFYFWFQRLAIELFRRQTSRSSSPPEMRLASGPTTSERDLRSVKSDDDIQATLTNAKKVEEEERTQHDDSNVRNGMNIRLHVARPHVAGVH